MVSSQSHSNVTTISPQNSPLSCLPCNGNLILFQPSLVCYDHELLLFLSSKVNFSIACFLRPLFILLQMFASFSHSLVTSPNTHSLYMLHSLSMRPLSQKLLPSSPDLLSCLACSWMVVNVKLDLANK